MSREEMTLDERIKDYLDHYDWRTQQCPSATISGIKHILEEHSNMTLLLLLEIRDLLKKKDA